MYRGSSLILSSYSSIGRDKERKNGEGRQSGRAIVGRERHLIPVCRMHSAIRRDDAGDRSGGRRRDGGIEQNEMNPLSTYHNTAVGANLNFDFMQQYVWGFWTRSNEKGSSKFMKTFTDGSDQAPRGALLSPVAAGVNTKQGRSLSLPPLLRSLIAPPLSLSRSLSEFLNEALRCMHTWNTLRRRRRRRYRPNTVFRWR